MNVPDERFKWLCDLFKPKSEVPAFLEIVDIAGLVRCVPPRRVNAGAAGPPVCSVMLGSQGRKGGLLRSTQVPAAGNGVAASPTRRACWESWWSNRAFGAAPGRPWQCLLKG